MTPHNSMIVPGNQGSVAAPFRWRDRHGAFHDPRSMETRHLFFTVAMIWNHTMPAHAQTHDFKRYTFGPEYTPDYFRDAVRHLMGELLRRDDLTAWQSRKLQWMRSHFHAGEFEEVYLIGAPE